MTYRTPTERDVDRALQAGQRKHDSTDPAFEAAVERVLARRTSDKVQSPRSRRRKIVAGIAIVTASLAAAGSAPALAEKLLYLTQTGVTPVTGENSELHPDSELLDLEASDFDEFAQQLWADNYELPADYRAADVMAGALEQLRVETGEVPWQGEKLIQSVNVDRVFEIGTRCIWLDEWIDNPDGSESRLHAQGVLEDSLSWSWTAWLLSIENDVALGLQSDISGATEPGMWDAYYGDSCSTYLSKIQNAGK